MRKVTRLSDDGQDAVDCFVLTLVKLGLASYEDLDRILQLFDDLKTTQGYCEMDFRWDAGL